MTVKELIEKLQAFEGSIEVGILDPGYGTLHISDVQKTEDDEVVYIITE